MTTRTSFVQRGVATVELAISLPIIVIIVFGTISAAQLVSLKHQAQLMADNFARVSIDLNIDDLEKVLNRELKFSRQTAGLKGASVSIDYDKASELLTVSVLAPISQNMTLFGRSLQGSSQSVIEAEATTFRPRQVGF